MTEHLTKLISLILPYYRKHELLPDFKRISDKLGLSRQMVYKIRQEAVREGVLIKGTWGQYSLSKKYKSMAKNYK